MPGIEIDLNQNPPESALDNLVDWDDIGEWDGPANELEYDMVWNDEYQGDQDRDGRTEGVQVPAADSQGADGDQDDAAADGVQAEGLSNGMQQRGGVEPLGVAAAWIDSAARRRGVPDTFTEANGRERRRYLKQREDAAASIAAFRTRSRERVGMRSVA
ncbi:hypothetical protein ABZP36_018279 [Zizania latifolia]